jgi:hypothetical protein
MAQLALGGRAGGLSDRRTEARLQAWMKQKVGDLVIGAICLLVWLWVMLGALASLPVVSLEAPVEVTALLSTSQRWN